MKFIIYYLFFLSIVLGKDSTYFQQHVAYDIDVKLNDSLHTLEAFEKIIYSNNSPDTLNFIWFHIWPNAYKNTQTAFAKQKKRFFSTKFEFSDLKDRGYIDSLDFKIDNVSAVIESHPDWIDVIKVHLPSPLLPSGKIQIETPFFVKIPKVFSRLGHIGQHYEITQWYPKPAVYDQKGWHPMPYLDMGEFYSEFGSFNVKITLPSDYRIMATGDLINGEKEYAWLDSLADSGDSLHSLDQKEFQRAIQKLQKKKKNKNPITKIISIFKNDNVENNEITRNDSNLTTLKTLHFYQNNVHDFAWFADKNWIVRKGELYLADSTHKVKLWSMYKPKNAELWENSIEYLHDAGYWYSKFNGDYPYNHITAVDGDLSAGGGMEYPNITVISKMGSKHLLEMVIMHEVGHNWFYGILGSNERDHAWMDEGLNEFCNIRYWDKKYANNDRRWVVNEFSQKKLGPLSIAKKLQFGFFEYAGYTSWIKKGDEEPLETSSNDFKQRTNYWLSYSKPLVYSWHLLDYLGESVIDSILQNYYNDWKFRHPYPSNFFHYVEKYSNKNVDWFTKDLFYKTGYVDYQASIVKNDVIFTNYGSLVVPFKVAFYDKERKEISRRWFENIRRVESVPLPKGARSVIIDPDKTLPDINRPNNATLKPIKFTWILDQPEYYKKEIFWSPWFFSANQYNGFTPGFLFYHGFVPGYDYGMSIRPMWDVNNNELVGTAKYFRELFSWGNFFTSSYKFEFSNYSSRKGLFCEFQGKQKKHLESYPLWTSIFNFNYHKINLNGVDKNYFDKGEILVGYAELKLHNRPNPFLNYFVRSALQTGIAHCQFLRFNVQTNIYYRFTKKIRAKLRIWVGGFLDKVDLPKQYYTYLSGSIDPDFRNEYIFNRTEKVNDIAIGTKQYEINGPSIHGLLFDENNRLQGFDKWIFSINFDINLPKIPGKTFIDIALLEGNNSYIDFGIKKTFGPLECIIPIYQSWNTEPLVKNKQELWKRFRVKITIPSFNFRKLL